ncbi:MAG: TetR/AcrR family transcriptional regulator [Candidatus Dormiibacterota bacterium]
MSCSSRKQPRGYASPLRTAQAAQTRQRILGAAGTCFASKGYSATTLTTIAGVAQVSVETVQAHGPKRALLLAAFEQAFALSEGQDSILDRPEMVEVAARLTDPVDFIRFACGFLAEAAERSSGLWLALYHASTSDPEIKEAFDGLSQRVRADTLRLVTMVADRGGLRSDRTPQRLADELDVLYLPSGYERLINNAGWTTHAYGDYLFNNSCRILFPLDVHPTEQ